MKGSLFTILVLFGICMLQYANGQTFQANIQGPHTIKITGHTNVNSFTLNYTGKISAKRQISFGKTENNKTPISGDNKVILAVDKFSSPNQIITNDFKKMLQAEKHPHISIELVQLIKEPGKNTRNFVMAILSIAGVQRLEILPVTVIQKPDNLYTFTSHHKISLKNYKLQPPKKLMGMINIKDEVYIDLGMTIKYAKN